LIIKLDEIGDYILFRNFLKIIRESKAYERYRITLLGNDIWKEITEKFDKNFIDEFIWMDKRKFSKNLFYRRNFLKAIIKTNFQTAINFHISRNFYFDDLVIKVVNAKNKIGHKTDLANLFIWQKNISDNYYSNLINIPGESFEFTKNKKIIENLLSEQISLTVPYLDVKVIADKRGNKENNVVLFIGSKRDYLRWAVENFIRIAEHIISRYQYNIVLIGSAIDIRYTKKFKSLLKTSLLSNIINLTAKTSLIDSIKLISKAKLTISNDSGMAHISAAIGTPTIIILNGSRFGRFFPYPEYGNMKVVPIYPPMLEDYKINLNEFVSEYKYKSKLDINSIPVEKVIKEVDNILEDDP
jgi:ADP-heptose:LPS heptosyltransferase